MWDNIIQFIQNQVLPIINAGLVTLIPAITPFVTSKISAKIRNIVDVIDNKITGVENQVNREIGRIQDGLNHLTILPDKIQTLVTPLFDEVRELRNMILLLAENSRVPQEVKNEFKRRNEVEAPNANLLSIIDVREGELQKAYAEISRLTELVTKASEPILDKAPKKRSKKTNSW